MSVHPAVAEVTARIAGRSRPTRDAYLAQVEALSRAATPRSKLGCANVAHAFAACADEDKSRLHAHAAPNLAIVTAYNDMLSAHQPYEGYPAKLRASARARGASAQVAGGVPAMCDGVTQGRAGMELSLFSRDVIAMGTAVALSHDVYDGALLLGICDKIVPGLLIGALSFGHLPAIFVPSGPMASGLSNAEKAKMRQLAAEGRATREDLLEAESKSYHGPGTCTFYGTANSNQVLLEMMGLQLPGSSFVHPHSTLRDALTDAAVDRLLRYTALAGDDAYRPIGRIVDERAIVNAVVGLHATGGSTNHLIHLVAIARAAGIRLEPGDFAALADVVPLLTRMYPNGSADVNRFQAAGGVAFVVGELLDAGLLHGDVETVAGPGLARYAEHPWLAGDALAWAPLRAPRASGDAEVLRPVASPFSATGALRVLTGNLGTAALKLSACPADRHVVEAPAVVIDNPSELKRMFERGELARDFVAVVRYQGPRANGMPEQHSLMPVLGLLQDRGHRVALVTDGRLSGASGKVPAAIHVVPEAAAGGPLARVRDGDVVRVDGPAGRLDVRVPAAEFERRVPDPAPPAATGLGRDLFAAFRRTVGDATMGASVFGDAS
ncbi:MAG: phosphogluconate dehydratase [Steroidobacteraceae bacterium]